MDNILQHTSSTFILFSSVFQTEMDFFDVVAAEHRGTQIPGNTTIWMIAFGATDSNDAFAVSFMAPCSTAFACFSSAAQVQEKKCLSRRDGKQFVEHFVFVLG